MSEWQEIESAPRNGEDILVYSFFLGMQVASFDEGAWIVFNVPTSYLAEAFTHWQPLPPAPEAK